MHADTSTLPAHAQRTEAELEDELAEALVRAKMLELELRRLRDPRRFTPGWADGADAERAIAEGRARSLAKLEATR